MADPGIVNPLGANLPPGVLSTSQTEDFWGLDPAVTIAALTALVPATLGANITKPAVGEGILLELQSWNGLTSGAASAPTHPTVTLSSTTADGGIIGVGIGGQVQGMPVTTPGQIVTVKRWGITKVIVDNTTVVGHALVQSTTTAGVAHDSGAVTATNDEVVGFALQALTVSSGLGMIYAMVKLT
jgi:hypothetical protein